MRIAQQGLPFSSYDYLRITNDNGQEFGVFCGERSGESVVVTGYLAVITFHSDGSAQRRGFLLNITEIPPGKYDQNAALYLETGTIYFFNLSCPLLEHHRIYSHHV